MVLDAKFKQLTDYFNIQRVADWSRVTPEEILALGNIGPKTVNHLRLHLANHGITLRDDQTPAYWQANLTAVRGATSVAKEQKSVLCPFTILIDSAEQHPWRFQGIRADAKQQYRPMIVRTHTKHLGPTHGDYSIVGLERWIHIERKSKSDVIGTVLGWGDRREQFERTLSFLSEIPFAAVIVECSSADVLKTLEDPTHPSNRNSSKPPQVRKKIFHRQVNAWRRRYGVHWIFEDTRELAERTAFRLLEGEWYDIQAERKRANLNNTKTTKDL